MIILLHNKNGYEVALNTDSINYVTVEKRSYMATSKNMEGICNILYFKDNQKEINIKETPEEVVKIANK